MPRALRYLFLAAVLLVAFGLPLSAAVVTGANVQRYYKDGSGGYDYERMLAGSNAGAIDTLVTDGGGHLVVSTTGTATVSGTVNQGTGGSSAWKVDGSAVTQPVSGTTTANQGTAGASPWLTTPGAATTSSVTLQNAATGTGNGTVLTTDGYAVAAFTVSISATATITWEANEDGATWFPMTVVGATGVPASGTVLTTASGLFTANVAGYKQVRARISTYGSGSVTVTGHASLASNPQRLQTVSLMGATGTAVNSVAVNADGITNNTTPIEAATFPLLYVGASVSDRQRTPNIYKTATATASGNTALWTPTSGKKFRLMRFKVDVTANASLAAGAIFTVGLQDATSDLGVSSDIYVPTTAVTTGMGGWTSGWIDLGNGKLSSVANNVLNVNLSAALATGDVRVTACGIEE